MEDQTNRHKKYPLFVLNKDFNMLLKARLFKTLLQSVKCVKYALSEI